MRMIDGRQGAWSAWSDTIPNTNFAQGRLEWLVYSLLVAGGLFGVHESNMLSWNDDGRLGLNLPSEWKNPLHSLEQNLAEHHENALFLQGTGTLIGILLAIFLLRAVFTSGSYVKGKVFGGG